MRNAAQIKGLSIGVVLVLALAGCGGEPSEKDIQSAIMKEQQATPELMKGLVPEITGVKKVGCKADGDKAYVCDLEMDAKQFGTTKKAVAPVRFIKASDGWVITK